MAVVIHNPPPPTSARVRAPFSQFLASPSFQIGKQDIPAHRAVLAAASPYLLELFTSEEDQQTRKEVEGAVVYQLNGGFDRDALERLIEYAYTAR